MAETYTDPGAVARAEAEDQKCGETHPDIPSSAPAQDIASAQTGLIEIRKNSREVLRISIDKFKGRTLLSFRVWYEPREGGDMRPGRDGFAIAVERLPEVLAALRRISDAA